MFSEDLDVFLDVDDFATAAVFNAVADIVGIFDNGATSSMGLSGQGPRFRCKESDVPAAAGKSLRVAGTLYTIVGSEPDGFGLTVLQLRAP